MRLFLALCVVILACAAWFAYAPRRDAGQATIQSPALPPGSEEQTPTEGTHLEPVAARMSSSRTAESAPAAVSQASSAPLCRVQGRTVDEQDAPLANVRVTWRELDARNLEISRLELVTDADGVFRFEVPLPKSESQRLVLVASDFRAVLEHAFGNMKGVETRRLVASDNDLGEFVLEARGVVVGRVLTEAGLPVEGIALALDGPAGQSGSGTSGPDGRFQIAHARAGRAWVVVRTLAFLPRTRPVVEVIAGGTTDCPDIVVADAPSITGVVVDESGTPLEDITILGMSSLGGSGIAKARSGEHGAFTLNLWGPGRFTLEVKAAGEFVAWGGRRDDPTCTFDSGARAVNIVLLRAPRMTFRIVDAKSRDPIEQFGLRITELTGQIPKFPEAELALEHHPQGEVQLPVRGESRVAVAAPGFADTEVPVAADHGSSTVQTIALLRASGITGRVILGEKPLTGAAVRLRRERTDSSAPTVSVADAFKDKARPNGLSYPVRPRGVGSDADGVFGFTRLPAGTYAIEVEGAGGGKKEMRALQVPPEDVLQLGDVVLDAEALLRVVVKPAPNESPIGFRVMVGDQGIHRIGDADGSCLFKGLAAGSHWLVWERPGENRLSSTDRRRIEFELRAGETREIVIDAARSAPCQLTVRVMRRGAPVPDVFVNARTEPNPQTAAVERRLIGKTDSRGVATGSIEGGLRVQLEVLGIAKRVIGIGAGPLDLVAGGNVESTVELESGRIVVELPSTLARPELGSVTLTIQNDVARAAVAITGEPRSLDEFPYQPVWATSSIDFGEAPVGRHGIQLQFQRFVREAGSDNPKAGRWTALREPFSTTVEVKDGETTRIVVP